MRKIVSLILISTFGILSACSQDNPTTVKKEEHGKINFKVKFENISKTDILNLNDGKTSGINLSGGVWAVYNKSNPIFTSGSKDKGEGLENLAEDGDSSKLETSFKTKTEVISFGKINALKPGESAEISFSAEEGSKLTFANMFVQSNDLFYSFEENGIELFDKAHEPIKGDFTSSIKLWDAGTEENQEPGKGADQPLSQKQPNTGKTESNNIGLVKDSFTYPEIGKVLKVTVDNDDKH